MRNTECGIGAAFGYIYGINQKVSDGKIVPCMIQGTNNIFDIALA